MAAPTVAGPVGERPSLRPRPADDEIYDCRWIDHHRLIDECQCVAGRVEYLGHIGVSRSLPRKGDATTTRSRLPTTDVHEPGEDGADRRSAQDCHPSELSEHLGRTDAEQLAQAFAALADPVRLRLLHLVAQAGEVCSCDLAVPLDKAQPTVSHHTSVLADAGLIVGDRRGRWVWWHVVPERLATLRSALDLMPMDGGTDEADSSREGQ